MQGVMILMISQFIIKIAGLLYKIYLTNKEGFGDTGNAIFSAGFQIYTIFLAISSIGVPNVMSQLISSKSAIGDNRGAYKIFKIAIFMFGIIGFIGTIILFCYAEPIANTYLGIPEAELTIIALAPSVFMVAVLSVLRGYFNGREKIYVTANSQSIEQILKTTLTIIVVEIFSIISSKNTVIMVAGAALAATIATFISFAYLYLIFIKNKKEIWIDVVTSKQKDKESVIKIVKTIIGLFIPMALSALLSAANRSIDAFSVVNTISKTLGSEEAKFQYGILTGKVEGLVILPYSFNIAFAISLIPTISAAQATGEMDKAVKRIKFSCLSTILITLPCTAVLFVFAEPILKLLFPNAYLGSSMLKLCSLSIVFVAVTQTIGGVLQGLKKVKESVIAIGIGVIVKLVLNSILLQIPSLNINGAIIATIISHITTFGISMHYLKKYIKIKFAVKKFIIKPVISTIVMIWSAYEIYFNFEIFTSQNIRLIISLITGVVLYIISIIMLKILSKEEIYMLPYGNKIYEHRKARTSVK